MIDHRQFSRSTEIVRGLLNVRELFYAGYPNSFDTYPTDSEAIEILDGLVHRVLSKLVDQAAAKED